MSQFHNNNLLHNIRAGVRMVDAGMPPEVAAFAMIHAGIPVPAPLLAAMAQPGVLQAMEAKPFTHARADEHIAGYKAMKESLAQQQVNAKDFRDETDNGVIHINFLDDEDTSGDFTDGNTR